MSYLLAVDFGTSNTAAAILTGGRAEALALSHEGNLMPSAVFVESPEHIEVGDVALNRATMNPAAFVPAPKRSVGMPAASVNGYDLPVSVLVAAVFGRVIAQAAAQQGGLRPAGLVLTHPEEWSPGQLAVLTEAAQRVGFEPRDVHLVSEPRAAVAHYARSQPPTPGSDVAVFDFGGGTLDVAVLRARGDGGFDVVAARGDNGLGGRNIDGLVRRWVDAQLEETDPGLLDYLRTAAPAHVARSLDDAIRRAKELLSSMPSATIAVIDGRADKQVVLTITREEFEQILAPELDRAVAVAHGALADAGHRPGTPGVAALYLTGGSTRIPLVHQRLGALGPVATLDDPKTVVSLGALVQVGGALAVGADAPETTPLAPTPAPWRMADHGAGFAPTAGSGEAAGRQGTENAHVAPVAPTAWSSTPSTPMAPAGMPRGDIAPGGAVTQKTAGPFGATSEGPTILNLLAGGDRFVIAGVLLTAVASNIVFHVAMKFGWALAETWDSWVLQWLLPGVVAVGGAVFGARKAQNLYGAALLALAVALPYAVEAYSPVSMGAPVTLLIVPALLLVGARRSRGLAIGRWEVVVAVSVAVLMLYLVFSSGVDSPDPDVFRKWEMTIRFGGFLPSGPLTVLIYLVVACGLGCQYYRDRTGRWFWQIPRQEADSTH